MSKQEFSFGKPLERWFGPWPVQLAWFVMLSLVTRYAMLGDPNYHDDEMLFFLIGQKMLDGFIPYVDIWDRKGPGLFALYAGFAAISRSVLSYQIAALVFAALTAFMLGRIAYLYTGRLGAMLAGTFYLAMLPRVLGGGGQAGVFFNLFIITAAWLVLSRPVGKEATRHSLLAMLLCGVAITFKQTCVFDGAFLGLVLLWLHHKAGADKVQLLRAALLYMAAGAAPMLLAALVYVLLGHFDAFWHAMVLSNLNKHYDNSRDIGGRALAMIAMVVALLPFALSALAKRFEYDGKVAPRLLLGGWLAMTVLQLVAIPNFIDHYLIPVIMVMALCAAPALQREPLGLLGGLVALLLVFLFGPMFKFHEREQSREAMAELTAQIMADRPEPRPFIFQGPVALYRTTGVLPPTPLVFPLHLESSSERNVSQFDSAEQVRRILDWQPTTVLTLHKQFTVVNHETLGMVRAYVHANCRTMRTWNLPNRYGRKLYDVWSDCRVNNADQSPQATAGR